VIKGLASDTAPGGSTSDGSLPGDVPCVGLWCRPQALRPLPRLPGSGLAADTGGDSASDWDGWESGIGDADRGGSVEDTALIDVECP